MARPQGAEGPGLGRARLQCDVFQGSLGCILQCRQWEVTDHQVTLGRLIYGPRAVRRLSGPRESGGHRAGEMIKWESLGEQGVTMAGLKEGLKDGEQRKRGWLAGRKGRGAALACWSRRGIQVGRHAGRLAVWERGKGQRFSKQVVTCIFDIQEPKEWDWFVPGFPQTQMTKSYILISWSFSFIKNVT